MKEKVEEAFNDVWHEMQEAEAEFGELSTTHYAYAVLLEETDELWTAIKLNDRQQALNEARQVAATAIRFMIDFS